MLSCECPKACGTLIPAKIPLEGCNAFGNNDGVLFCDKEMENDANIPKGLYEDDCGGCSYDEKTRMLTCKRCRSDNGELKESKLQVNEGCIVIVDDGILKCQEEQEPKAQKKLSERVTKLKPETVKSKVSVEKKEL